MAGEEIVGGVDEATSAAARRGMNRVGVGGIVGMAAMNVGFELATAAPAERPAAVAGGIAMTAAGSLTRGLLPALGTLPVMAIELGAYYAVKGGLHALEKGVERSQERWRNVTRIGFQNSDTFGNESRALLTQRQQSLRAIQTSILNARSSIGNEAALTRRSVDEYL